MASSKTKSAPTKAAAKCGLKPVGKPVAKISGKAPATQPIKKAAVKK